MTRRKSYYSYPDSGYSRTYRSWGQRSNLAQPVRKPNNDRNNKVSEQIIVLGIPSWVVNPETWITLELIRAVRNSCQVIGVLDRWERSLLGFSGRMYRNRIRHIRRQNNIIGKSFEVRTQGGLVCRSHTRLHTLIAKKCLRSVKLRW